MAKPLIESRWNDKRAETTYRIKVDGASNFLLMNKSELESLRTLIDTTLEGTPNGNADK